MTDTSETKPDMPEYPTRRSFLQTTAAGAATLGAVGTVAATVKPASAQTGPDPIMLASSLIHNGRHEAFYGRATALWPFEYRMEQVAKAGYNAVGLLHWDLDHTLRYEAKGANIQQKAEWMKGVLDNNGIEHCEIEFLTQWMYPENDPRRMAEQPVRDMLRELGKVLKPFHMKVGNFFVPLPVEVQRENFKQLCQEFDFTDVAYEVLTLDPSGGDLDQLLSIVEGNNNGGLFFDTWHTNNLKTWNPNAKGHTYDEIASLPKGVIKGCELDDGWLVEPKYAEHFLMISSPQFLELTIHSRCCIGEGNFDVVGFIKAVKAAGWEGPMGNEIISENVSRYPIEMMLPHIYNTSLAHARNAYYDTPIPDKIRADYK